MHNRSNTYMTYTQKTHMHAALLNLSEPYPSRAAGLAQDLLSVILRLRRCPLMNDAEQCCGSEIPESINSLRKQVQALRRLLAKKEAALVEKCAKIEARCPHTRQILLPYDGPRDNGELDYQCIDCGALL